MSKSRKSLVSIASQDLEDETKKSSSTTETSETSHETGKRASSILKKSIMSTRKSSNRNVRFSKEAEGKISLDAKSTRFRESSIQFDRQSSRFSRLFESLTINRPRRSTFVRPVLKYKPTYQLESKKPFDTLVVQDLMKKIVEDRMEAEEKIEFDCESFCVPFVRNLSNEILQEVKAKEYDRYKIVATVTLGEKFHQSLHQSAMFMWNPETDAIAKYVYDRANLFVIANVFGIYYD